MSHSVFVETEFYLLLSFSVLLPVALYAYLIHKWAITRTSVALLGLSLLMISGMDIFLLRRLEVMANNSLSLLDDKIFASEVSLVLYLLPVLLAGVGVNIISDVLNRHLADAERKIDRGNR